MYSGSIWKAISLLKSPDGLFLYWHTDNYMDGKAKPVEPKSLINSFFHHYYTSFFVALKAFLTSHCVNSFFMCAMNNTARLHTSALKHSLIHFLLADWHKTLCQISCIELSASHKKARRWASLNSNSEHSCFETQWLFPQKWLRSIFVVLNPKLWASESTVCAAGRLFHSTLCSECVCVCL